LNPDKEEENPKTQPRQSSVPVKQQKELLFIKEDHEENAIQA